TEVTKEFVIDYHTPMGQTGPGAIIVRFTESGNVEVDMIMRSIQDVVAGLTTEQKSNIASLFNTVRGERGVYDRIYKRDIEQLRLIEKHINNIKNNKYVFRDVIADTQALEAVVKPPAVEAVEKVKVPEAKPPVVEIAPEVAKEVIIAPTEPVSPAVIEGTQGMRGIGALEKYVRMPRRTFTKLGQWRNFFKPSQLAEVLLHEEGQTKNKVFDQWDKWIGKNPERKSLVSQELNDR
ncbi:unnamed protein product, partial [marine sediment metagenome]